MKQTKVKKRCMKCGHVATVPPRQQRCYQTRFGRNSYACWGQLERVVRKPRNKKTLREAIIAMSEEGAREASQPHEVREPDPVADGKYWEQRNALERAAEAAGQFLDASIATVEEVQQRELAFENIGERTGNGGLACPCGYVNSRHQGTRCGRCGEVIRLTAKRPQDEAARKLALARGRVKEITTRMKRLTTSLHLWERRANYYAKRASMTDAEIAAEREKREAGKVARAKRKARRGIDLDGG